MRKLFWQMMVSLDGFMEGPNRELDWHVVDDEFQQYALEMLRSIDAMLLGRTTYQLFADYWPSATEPGAEELNALEKVVFSTTLNDVDWKNSRLVSPRDSSTLLGMTVNHRRSRPGSLSGYSARTVRAIPPRAENCAVTVASRGAQAFTKSLRMRFVTASLNARSLR